MIISDAVCHGAARRSGLALFTRHDSARARNGAHALTDFAANGKAHAFTHHVVCAYALEAADFNADDYPKADVLSSAYAVSSAKLCSEPASLRQVHSLARRMPAVGRRSSGQRYPGAPT